MSKVTDLRKYLNNKTSVPFIEHAGGIVELMRGCAEELPRFNAGLITVAGGFENYLNNDILFSKEPGERSGYWDVACGLSFNPVEETDGSVSSITFRVLNGRAVESINTESPDDLLQGTITLSSISTVLGFTAYNNLHPRDVFREWLINHNKTHGIETLGAPNYLFFFMLFDHAHKNGFRIQEMRTLGDKLEMELITRYEKLEVMVDYALFKSTHDIFSRLLDEEENR